MVMAKSASGIDQLKGASQDLLRNLGDKALDTVNDRVSGLTDKLSGVADGGGVVGSAMGKAGESAAKGDNPVVGGLKGLAGGVKDKVTGGGSSGGGGKPTKSTNIIESIDVGVPIHVAYNQWTQFGDFPSLMKKVEKADAEEDTKIKFKAQIFWSHREWEATILEQVPDERIVWRSEGEKGHVDGAVTFHELAPSLTRILVVLEYYPQGLFERTGNLWRAQGRRARLELKHFARHVMTRSILEEDEVEGWRGVIEDGEVEESHEEHVEAEESEQDEGAEDSEDYGDDEYSEDDDAEGEEESEEDAEEEPEDEYDEEGEEESEEDAEEEPEDEYEEEDDAEEEDEAEEEPEDEYDEEGEEESEEDAEEEPEDEYEEESEEDDEYEEQPQRRRRAS
jgi:uncharacterized membrane protein